MRLAAYHRADLGLNGQRKTEMLRLDFGATEADRKPAKLPANLFINR